ncbi:MAG TPA: M14 family zinc carboxypeptidase [Pyrinomonadaceae bacterium]
MLISLHSYANLVMWPWGHTATAPPNGAELALIGPKFAGYNGYTPQQANQLYPSSGKTDEWAYGELGIPSYVFEVGIGEGECGGFMPPYSCLDSGYEGSFWPRNLPTFLYAARIARAPCARERHRRGGRDQSDLQRRDAGRGRQLDRQHLGCLRRGDADGRVNNHASRDGPKQSDGLDGQRQSH